MTTAEAWRICSKTVMWGMAAITVISLIGCSSSPPSPKPTPRPPYVPPTSIPDYVPVSEGVVSGTVERQLRDEMPDALIHCESTTIGQTEVVACMARDGIQSMFLLGQYDLLRPELAERHLGANWIPYAGYITDIETEGRMVTCRNGTDCVSGDNISLGQFVDLAATFTTVWEDQVRTGTAPQ